MPKQSVRSIKQKILRQQEYIRQSATLLKIDESGFTNLVNKFIKERLSKEEKTSAAEAKLFDAANTQGNEKQADDAINLLMEDEFQERSGKRLIEYGNQLLAEDKYVADAIFRSA